MLRVIEVQAHAFNPESAAAIRILREQRAHVHVLHAIKVLRQCNPPRCLGQGSLANCRVRVRAHVGALLRNVPRGALTCSEHSAVSAAWNVLDTPSMVAPGYN